MPKDSASDDRSGRDNTEEKGDSSGSARSLFSSMFFGRPDTDSSRRRYPLQRQDTTKPPIDSNHHRNQESDDPEDTVEPPPPESSAASQLASRIDDWIPRNDQELRQTAIFGQAYKLLQFQRDSYLVGSDYADWRKKERQRVEESSSSAATSTTFYRGLASFDIPHDPTASGHYRVVGLLAQYVPSPAVRQAATPLVVDQLQHNGTLFQLSRDGLVNLILNQQGNLDRLLKTTLTGILTNPDNRVNIKHSTEGYLQHRFVQDSPPVAADMEEAVKKQQQRPQ